MEKGERPLGGGTSVDKAFLMILADGRRKLDDDEERASKALWRRIFQRTPEKQLLEAVETWLIEHSRGRPNVGEVLATIKALALAAGETEQPSSSSSDSELKWAVSILEAHGRGGEWARRMEEANYVHTLESARVVLRRRGFQSWQDARAYQEPGWMPATTTEVIQ